MQIACYCSEQNSVPDNKFLLFGTLQIAVGQKKIGFSANAMFMPSLRRLGQVFNVTCSKSEKTWADLVSHSFVIPEKRLCSFHCDRKQNKKNQRLEISTVLTSYSASWSGNQYLRNNWWRYNESCIGCSKCNENFAWRKEEWTGHGKLKYTLSVAFCWYLWGAGLTEWLLHQSRQGSSFWMEF